MAEVKGMNEFREDHRVRIFLQPIASPWVMGLFGFSVAAFVMGGRIAGWFSGISGTGMMYVAFAALLGGFAQLLSAMWAFKARDTLSTAFNGIWGSFWLALGFLNLIAAPASNAAAGPMAPAAAPVGGGLEMGFWYIPMAFITAACAASALSHSKALSMALTVLTAGCVLMAIGLLGESVGLEIIGGWLFAISTAFAWYTATASLIAASYGATKIPVQQREPIDEGLGEPGVVHDLGSRRSKLSGGRKTASQL